MRKYTNVILMAIALLVSGCSNNSNLKKIENGKYKEICHAKLLAVDIGFNCSCLTFDNGEVYIGSFELAGERKDYSYKIGESYTIYRKSGLEFYFVIKQD